jgi:hypothetical protein
MLGGQAGKLRLGLHPGLDVDEVGQPVPETADHRHVAGADAPLSLRFGGGGQHRRQRFAGDRFALAQIGGLVDAPRRLSAGDAQPVG